MIKLFLLIAIVVAASAVERVVLYERRGVPADSEWRQSRRADEEHQVTFTLTLNRQNLDKLEAKWYSVSDPDSSDYTQHLTRDQISDLIAAPVSERRQVMKWVRHVASEFPREYLTSVVDQKDAIVVTCAVAVVEKLFHTEMFFYKHQTKNVHIAKHHGPLSVPSSIRPTIAMISGITELPPPNRLNKALKIKQPADNTGDECNVPYSMKNLYDWPENFTAHPNANASIYAETSVDTPDGFGIGAVADWERANNLPKNPIKCILGTGRKDFVHNDTDDEAQLDTQMITGMAPGTTTCFYVMQYGDGWMYELGRYIFATPTAPLVLSISYGWFENQECNTGSSGIDFVGNCTYYHIPNSEDYVHNANIEFMKLGVAGHTVVVSSGDDGTAGGHSSENNCKTMGPQYPAASPYVTTVGATSVQPEKKTKLVSLRAGDEPSICTNTSYQCVCSTSKNEQAATNNNNAGFDSGGGFSLYALQPSYQATAVSGYIKSGVKLPSGKYWNQKNRGYPDIAAVGENVCVLSPGQPCNMLAGTSCSAPITAAMFSSLNSDRIGAGKNPLGPVNGLIYKLYGLDKSKYFNNQFDEANNSGECPATLGFYTKPGFWSPITGCGSPKVSAIREYVASLP